MLEIQDNTFLKKYLEKKRKDDDHQSGNSSESIKLKKPKTSVPLEVIKDDEMEENQQVFSG